MPTHFDHPSTRAQPCPCEMHERRRRQQRESKARTDQRRYKVSEVDRVRVEVLVARGFSPRGILRETKLDRKIVWQILHTMELRNASCA